MTPAEIIDAIIDDNSASEVSDKIKDVLFTKSSEKIEGLRGSTASKLFGDGGAGEEEPEVEQEIETEEPETGDE
jgi:hypothetical protein